MNHIDQHFNRLQPTITVPFFTDYWGSYNIREFTKHPITWADPDYESMFNDFDKRVLRQYNQADKDTLMKDILEPCDAFVCKDLYAQQMGQENFEKLLEETNTEVSMNFSDTETFERICFSMTNGAMSNILKIGAFVDYKQLGILVNNYPFRVKVLLHRLPEQFSLSKETLKEYTPVNVLEDINLMYTEYREYNYEVGVKLDNDRTVNSIVTEYRF